MMNIKQNTTARKSLFVFFFSVCLFVLNWYIGSIRINTVFIWLNGESSVVLK